jgi:hypothetical protein
MPQRKVRHALITYVVDGRQEMAFRGQVVDITDGEADRLDRLGATVEVSKDLERPGTLAALPESPTDEEIVAWCLAASPVELEHILRVRPELGPRIEGAYQHVVDARKAQDENLKAVSASISGASSVGYMKTELGNSAMLDEGVTESDAPHPVGSAPAFEPTPQGSVPVYPPPGDSDGPAVDITDPTSTDADAVVASTGEAIGSPGDEPVMPGTTAEVEQALAAQGADVPDGRTEAFLHVGDDTAAHDTSQVIVGGTVDDVRTFLADNPEQANQVLAAEKAARALEGKEPRAGVVKAVDDALAHASE